ncbi:MAG: hypothetical protein U0640_02530 [Phycisphaerales bacterium]
MHKTVTSCALLVLIAGAAIAQDGVEITNVPEMSEFMLPGPNVGNETLPTPKHDHEPREVDGKPVPHEMEAHRVHMTLGLDLTGAYYSRGLRQEDRGVIAQPYATVGLDFFRGEDWNWQAYVGTWNSIHDRKTGAATPDESRAAWYEADAYFGVTAETGKWTLGAQYGWFLSPNDAFTTVEELQFSASYDDSEAMGAWAMSPNATLVIETGDGTSDGFEKGAYLQLGVEPSYEFEQKTFESLSISAPIIVGLSAWDYYQESDDEDNFFGFASVGVKLSADLYTSDEWGSVSAYVAGNYLLLGDMASQVNDDEDTAFVWSAGISYSY